MDIIFVKTNKTKISAYNTVEILCIIVIMILHHTINSRTKSVSLAKVAVIFDYAITNFSADDSLKGKIKPWHFGSKINAIITILTNAKIIITPLIQNDIKISLTEHGTSIARKIVSDESFSEINELIKNSTSNITEVALKKYSIGN